MSLMAAEGGTTGGRSGNGGSGGSQPSELMFVVRGTDAGRMSTSV